MYVSFAKGSMLFDNRKYEEAISEFKKTLSLANEYDGDVFDKARIYMSLGNACRLAYHISKAADYYLQALRICEKEADVNMTRLLDHLHSKGVKLTRKGLTIPFVVKYREKHKKDKRFIELANRGGRILGIIRGAYNRLASLYEAVKDYPKAIHFAKMAEKNAEEVGAKETYLKILEHLGQIYFSIQKLDSAMYYYNRCYVEANKQKHFQMIVQSLDGKALVYSERKQFDSALAVYENIKERLIADGSYYNQNDVMVISRVAEINVRKGDLVKARDIYEELLQRLRKNPDDYFITICELELGNVYSLLGSNQKAILFLERAKSSIIAHKDYENVLSVYQTLAKAYEKSGDYKNALKNQNRYYELKDSLFSITNANSIADLQKRFEVEKKDGEIEGLAKQKKAQKAIIAGERRTRNIVIGGLILTALLLLLVFRNFLQKKKANNILELQKAEIQQQSTMLEHAYTEIKDSINYARRIQQAILPETTLLKNYFSESFVLYKPKDVVSGDFYEFFPRGQEMIIATVDCTGHGVPGAFMSMIGNEQLNKIIVEKQISQPAEVLNALHEGIRHALKQDKQEGETRDGMDIALIKINKNTMVLEYSGANRQLWILRNGEILEFKADKQPIGGLDSGERKKFTNVEIKLQKCDVVYTFTDGFADQFGGPKSKKFMLKNLERRLIASAQLPLVDQMAMLESEFNVWRGTLEQTDDVLVIGVKIDC